MARNSAGYSIAPVAMMAPWPGIRRGTEAVVPRVPGFVREIVVPSKSDSFSFPARARATTSSEAARNSPKRIFSAPFTFGTRSVREPSAFVDIDGDAETDFLAPDPGRLAARPVVGVVQRRHGLQRLDDRPGGQVRERDLRLLVGRAGFVDEAAILVEELDGDLALRRRRRDGKARLHVLGDAGGDPADRHALAFDGGSHGRGRRRGGAPPGPDLRSAARARRIAPGSTAATRRRPTRGWPGTGSGGPRRNWRWRRTRRRDPRTRRRRTSGWTWEGDFSSDGRAPSVPAEGPDTIPALLRGKTGDEETARTLDLRARTAGRDPGPRPPGPRTPGNPPDGASSCATGSSPARAPPTGSGTSRIWRARGCRDPPETARVLRSRSRS